MRIINTFCLACLLLFSQCAEESEPYMTESIQFAFKATGAADDGRTANELPAGSSLVISVTKSTGEQVLDHQKIELLKIGDDFISLPIELAPGQYKLTDFLVVNDLSEVLFATPKTGSPLATAVSHSLPFTFAVQKNGIKNIIMDVIDATINSAADFGYTSFHVNIVRPFKIATFIEKDGGLRYASSIVYLLNGNDTLRTYSLAVKINTLKFYGDPSATYTLVVIKDGYSRYTTPFVYESVAAEGIALKIVLSKAFTMTAVSSDASGLDRSFEINLSSPGANISVDWGDGTSTDYNITGEFIPVRHVYPASRKYFVSITGDINEITYFNSFYGFGMIDKINFMHLTKLSEIRIGATRGPRVIDLSFNSRIERVLIYEIPQLQDIKLPNNNKITDLTIQVNPAFPNLIPVNVLNSVIHSIFTSTFQHQQSGHLVLDISADELSPQAIFELLALKNDFDWSVTPDPSE